MPTADLACPKCARPIPAHAPKRLCSYCLVSALFENLDSNDPDPSRVAEIPSLPSGRVGSYELVQEIGRGGMGVVFKARDPRLNRFVALKLILTGTLASDLEVKRFRAEAEAAAQLEHPHIVPIFEVGEANGCHYFAMKLMEGGSLADRLRTQAATLPTRPDFAAAVSVLIKIARAIHYAHQRGILHRDLKPANIMMDAAGEPVVTDFGLARRLESESDLTLSGTVVGSPSYMAPEQASGRSREVTTAADVYSLGALLFHLLAGHPPFCEDSALATIRAVMDNDVPRLSNLNPSLDHDLETICLKCLEKDPARRYQSAAALADDLERWERQEPIQARPASALERLRKWGRRHPALATLVAGTALGAFAFVAMLVLNEQRVRRERDEAQHQERRATSNEVRAVSEARRAETNALVARVNLYAADLYVAAQFVDAGQMGPALALLRNHQPAPGQADLRGFEWWLLRARCQGDTARVLNSPGEPVNTLAFSPDGRWMAAGDHRLIHIWDTTTWQRLTSIPDTSDAVQLREKGPQIAALIEHDPAKAFSALLTGQTLESQINPSRPDMAHASWSLAFSPDGSMLATGGRDEYVKVWDVRSRRLRSWHPLEHADIGFVDDERLAVSGEQPDKSRHAAIVAATTGKVLQALPANVTALAVPMGGGKLHALLDRKDATVWEGSPPKIVSRHGLPHPIYGHLVVSPSQTRMAGAIYWDAESAYIWSTTNPAVRASTPAFGSTIHALAFSPDDRELAVGLRDSTVRLINAATGKEMRRLTGHQAEVLAVGWTPANQLVSAGRDSAIRVWDIAPIAEAGGLSRSFKREVIAPQGRQVAALDDSGRIVVWDVAEVAPRVLGNGTGHLPLAFSLKEAALLVATTNAAQPIRLEYWRLSDGSLLRSAVLPDLEKHQPGTELHGPRLRGTPDGDRAMFIRREGAILFDARTGQQLARCGQAHLQIQAPDIVLDSHRFISRVFPVGAAIWDLNTGNAQTIFRFPKGVSPAGIAVSPDYTVVVTADSDNLIRVWDAASGALVRQLTGHGASVRSLAISVDGRTLASCGTDRVAKLWNLATGRELMTLSRGFEMPRMKFLPDGKTLIGFGLTPGVRMWTVDPTIN